MAASPASVGGGAYSCEMAEQTRQWMEAIAVFLRLHRPLLEAHVVNFFKDRLWEMVDAEWMECLRGEPWRVCSSCPPDASRSTDPVHYENLSSPLGRLFFHGSNS